jgi:hypothetical protein
LTYSRLEETSIWYNSFQSATKRKEQVRVYENVQFSDYRVWTETAKDVERICEEKSIVN